MSEVSAQPKAYKSCEYSAFIEQGCEIDVSSPIFEETLEGHSSQHTTTISIDRREKSDMINRLRARAWELAISHWYNRARVLMITKLIV